MNTPVNRSGFKRVARYWKVPAAAGTAFLFWLIAPRVFFASLSLVGMAVLALSAAAMIRGFRRSRCLATRALWITAGMSIGGLAAYRLFAPAAVDPGLAMLAVLAGLAVGWGCSRAAHITVRNKRACNGGNSVALGVWALNFLAMQGGALVVGRLAALPWTTLHFTSALMAAQSVGLVARIRSALRRPDSSPTLRKGPTTALITLGALGLLLAWVGLLPDPGTRVEAPPRRAGVIPDSPPAPPTIPLRPPSLPVAPPASPSVAPVRASSHRWHRHAQTGVEMLVPDDWVVADSRNGFEVRASDDDLSRLARIIVHVESRGPRDQLRRKLSELLDPIRLQPGFRLLVEEDGTGAGSYPAKRFAAAVELQGVSMITDNVLIETDRRYVLLSFIATEQAFDTQLPHAARALESLRVEP